MTLLAACRSMKVKDIPADDQAAKIKIGGFIQMACAAGDESVNAILTMIVNKQGVEKNETETKAAEQVSPLDAREEILDGSVMIYI